MSLPTDRDARNALPIWDGCMKYFPDTWAEIAKVSALGAKQHGLGKLGWERKISTDHENKVMRHMLDHAAGSTLDTDGCFHLAKAAWRVLAALQLAIEAQAGVNSNQANQAIGGAHVSIRSHQEGSNAQRFGQEAGSPDHAKGHFHGSEEGSFRSQARQFCPHGETSL